MASLINPPWPGQWELPELSKKWELHETWGFLGSCFADVFGGRFKSLGFATWRNPGGTLYNPLSIQQQLELLLSPREIVLADLVQWQNLYHHFQFDTRGVHPDPHQLLDRLNTIRTQFQHNIKGTQGVFISLGTAHFFQYEEQVVCNCQKLPSSLFSHRVATLSELTTALKKIQTLLNQQGVETIVFTLSPVRYPKLGTEQNSLSKALLRVAIHEALNPQSQYFPIGEILLDELRDYRFYGADFKHPSKEAESYLFQRGCEKILSKESQNFLKKMNSFLQLKNHKSQEDWNLMDHKALIQKKREVLLTWVHQASQKLPDSFIQTINA